MDTLVPTVSKVTVKIELEVAKEDVVAFTEEWRSIEDTLRGVASITSATMTIPEWTEIKLT